jgi:type VI secretion system protein ImpB
MSSQEDIKRKAPTRVQIKYDVETEGEEPILELPFVVGVMADLSGMPADEKKPLKKRPFTAITRDNFNSVMAAAAPRVAFRVPNKLTDNKDEELNVELNFRQMSDFDPGRVAEQVPVLNELLKMRRQLSELLNKLDGNDALEKLLKEALENTSKIQAIGAARGQAPAGDATPA